MQIPAIQCAQCQKTVDKTTIVTNHATRSYSITVFCHGKQDSCELTERFLIDNHPFHFVKAVAFETK